MKRAAAEDFVKFVQGLINKLYQCVDTPVDEVSDLVQDFYHDLTERMAVHPLYKGELCIGELAVETALFHTVKFVLCEIINEGN